MNIDDLIRTVVRDELKPIRDDLRRLAEDRDKRRSEYLTVRNAAELANVHPSTIREWIKSGRLRAGDKPIRIRPDDLDAAMTSATRSSAVSSPDEQAISILRRSTTRRR